MIFVSYFSGKPYQICSDRLRLSLIKFKLLHNIEQAQNKGDKQLNISGKPQFVKDNLLKYRQSVCWVDADSEIVKHPSLLFENEHNTHLQIYNWLADNDNHVTRQNKFEKTISWITGKNPNNISNNKLLCSSGTFAFNYSPESLELLDKWIAEMKRTPHIPDDQVLDRIFNEGGYCNKLNYRWLPKSYNRMMRYNDWLSTSPVINNTETNMCEIKQTR